MDTVKMVANKYYEVVLMQDMDSMYVIRYGHVLGPLDVTTEKLSDFSLASQIFDMKVEEFEGRMQ